MVKRYPIASSILVANAAASRFIQLTTAREVVSITNDSPEELVIEVKAPSTAPVLAFCFLTSLLAIFEALFFCPTLYRAPAYNERKYGSSVEPATVSKFLNSYLRSSKLNLPS